MKVVWCILCRGRHEEFMRSFWAHAPHVDHTVYVLHGSDEENRENREFLESNYAKAYGTFDRDWET